MKATGLTTAEIKTVNKAAIYYYIYNAKTTSKQQITKDLEIGLTTVTQNLKLLEQNGLIERSGVFESTGGRPANAIQIVRNARIAVGIEILKSHFHMVAIDLYGKCFTKQTIHTPFSSTIEYCQMLGTELELFIEKNHLKKNHILGVSIAVQGIVASDGQTITYSKILNHPGLTLSDFQNATAYPCRLEHDSKAAAYVEVWRKEWLKDSIVLLLNKNLGSAVITNGIIQTGMHMHTGTIEHLCLNPKGPLCYCGQHGCFETYCSAENLDIAPWDTYEAFFAAVHQNHSLAAKHWDTYLKYLAYGIRNITVILDVPVILSGLLSPFIQPADLDKLYDTLEQISPFKAARNYLSVSSYGSLSPAIGAALSDIDQFLQNIFLV